MNKKNLIAIVASVGLTLFFACNQSLPEDVFPSPKKNEKTGKWGFVYEGKTIIKYKFDDADDFSSGLARVGLGEKWGYIDKKGKEIIPLKYDFASIFSDDVAKVGLDGKYGFIDKTGKEIIQLIYEEIYDFKEGLAKVLLNGKYGFIDKTGEEIIPLKYDDVGDFTNGLIKVKESGTYSYVDKTGKTNIPNNGIFGIINFSNKNVRFKAISETSFHSVALTDGQNTYEAWLMDMLAIFSLTKGTELALSFNVPTDFSPTKIRFKTTYDRKSEVYFNIMTSEWENKE